MDSIVASFFKNPFEPEITADAIIAHAEAGGLVNSVKPDPMSGKAMVLVGLMSVLTGGITLPLFIKLHDYIQKNYYAPEERKLLAVLGCKVAAAKIEIQGDERRIKIELGENDDSASTLYFTEKKTGNAGETQLFLTDANGERPFILKDADGEKPFNQFFSTLEQVQAFYKQDLAEDTDGIYSQNVSPKLFTASTLGVALCDYCTGHFDDQDLVNFEKLSGVKQGTGELTELRNPELKHLTSPAILDALVKITESEWQVTLSSLILLQKNPPIPADSGLTAPNIQSRAANLIKARAEEKVRGYIMASLESVNRLPDDMVTPASEIARKRNPEIEKQLIKLAGVHALAEAFLTPKEAGGDRSGYLQQRIRENADSLKTIQDIFGFQKPSGRKQDECDKECQAIASRFYKPIDSAGRLIRDNLEHAIYVCFRTLRTLPAPAPANG